MLVKAAFVNQIDANKYIYDENTDDHANKINMSI